MGVGNFVQLFGEWMRCKMFRPLLEVGGQNILSRPSEIFARPLHAIICEHSLKPPGITIFSVSVDFYSINNNA